MPIPITNPRVTQAIPDALGLDGRTPFQMDEVIAGVVQMLPPLNETPFVTGIRGAQLLGQGPVAAVGFWGGIGLRAARDTVLEIRGVHFYNNSGAFRDYYLQYVGPIVWSNPGYLFSATTIPQIQASPKLDGFSTASVPKLAAQNDLVRATGAILDGPAIDHVHTDGGSSTIEDSRTFDPPIYLWGAGGGRPDRPLMFAAIAGSSNTSGIEIGWRLREWLIPA